MDKDDLVYAMRSCCAVLLYKLGFKPYCSIFVDEETITAGYGKLSFNGDFKYPLPSKYVKKVCGRNKWSTVK